MQSTQINELAAALAKAQQQIKPAVKDANNPFFKSKYADLTTTWEACKDALNENGLSIVQTVNVTDKETGPVLTTSLLHTSGQWIEGNCPLINLKGDMQGLGSAMSYARRYSIAAICGVVTEDDDANTADQKLKSPGDIKSPTPITTIQAKITSSNSGGSESYIIPLKKFQGKKLSDLKDYEINQYCDWIRREGITKPEYLEFIQRAEEHLKKYYASKSVDMEIPF